MKTAENVYLETYPDVAAAVVAGHIRSGMAHYESYGQFEGRRWGGGARIEKILSAVDKGRQGLEIGPSFNPAAPRRAGFKVHTLDHMDREGLRKKYTGHGVNIDAIEDVDFVWRGERLVELIGQTGCYGWIIASHVIEHVPDLVTFLQQCEALLAPDGVLSLAVPDKRYCFDHFQPISTTGEVLDAYRERRTRPTPGQVFNSISTEVSLGPHICWGGATQGEFVLRHADDEAVHGWQEASNSEAYIDVHCWKFTPAGFRLMLADLHALGLTTLVIGREFESVVGEFFVTLGRGQISMSRDERLALLQRRGREAAGEA
jgi:hypothetical protein